LFLSQLALPFAPTASVADFPHTSPVLTFINCLLLVVLLTTANSVLIPKGSFANLIITTSVPRPKCRYLYLNKYIMAANANHGYTCSPAGSNNGILDYDNSDHVKIYSATSAPLKPKFDVTSKRTTLFLK
jgi:hypothetical protein